MDKRLHILGIRHHGPGSAALLVRALDELNPSCVLIEGPPEADDLIGYAGLAGMKPPLALLVRASADPNAAFFIPFAEFSPEWQAMRWAIGHGVTVKFIDWPAGVSIHQTRVEKNGVEENTGNESSEDPLERLAQAAGFNDGEAFWNTLIEQGRLGGTRPEDDGAQALAIFSAIEHAMIALHSEEAVRSEPATLREARREAWMRTHTRKALKEHDGPIAAVVGAWHASAFQSAHSAATDKAMLKGLECEKVDATWVPWTDSRLSAASGYRAGVISPGWYSHLWKLYAGDDPISADQFAAQWQAKTAAMLRNEGYAASTAAAIEAARLALALAALRARPVPCLEEMSEGALAALCHGDETPLRLIERKLYVGERVGEIDASVPQMPLARDLELWRRKTRLKPEDVDTELKVDLRSESGLLKSTLLHRLLILNVPWGRLAEAETGRGTFREVWQLRWAPELSVALADALIYGATIEQAAANALLERARGSSSISELAALVQQALVADVPEAASDCIERLQAEAVEASEITELMKAIAPLVRVLRYGTARELPERPLRNLIHALSVEVNAGIRLASRNLEKESAAERVHAMRLYDEAMHLLGDGPLLEQWHMHLEQMVEDDQVAALVSGFSLRRLHELAVWQPDVLSAAFSRHMRGQSPQHAGAFLESFLAGGAEVLFQDPPLLSMVDGWLCELEERDFIESLPLLRRAFSELDSIARRRLLERIAHGPQLRPESNPVGDESIEAFELALPLLYQILGVDCTSGGAQ